MYKIIANWKMYLTIEQSRNLAGYLAKWWKKADCAHAELIICPSVLAIHDVKQQLGQSGIRLGGQDVSMSHQLGAFTGQIPAQHLKELDLTHTIIGHSEMRRFYGVTDDMVAQQMQVALEENLIPIVCIGETKEERESGRTDQVITEQLHRIFSHNVSADAQIFIAYEPRWAIGTGKPVAPEEAERVHNLINHTLAEFFPKDSGMIEILYGGSVNAENIHDFLKQDHVHGALIGSASAKLDSLKAIIDTLKTNVC